MNKISFGGVQPNPKESKMWLHPHNGLKTYNLKLNKWVGGGSANEPSEPEEPVNPWGNIADGVYAVSADGNPINYTTADTTAIGVAVVAGNHKFMIAKNDATNGTANSWYWGYPFLDKDIVGITNISTGLGFLGLDISADFTTWTEGGLSDFNGKTNTAAIINAYTEYGETMNSRDMCSVLNMFNAATDGSNAGKNDWYIPACGQLGIMVLALHLINEALIKIGGTALENTSYWSSSEGGDNQSWHVQVIDGVIGYISRAYRNNVRFVRDIE